VFAVGKMMKDKYNTESRGGGGVASEATTYTARADDARARGVVGDGLRRTILPQEGSVRMAQKEWGDHSRCSCCVVGRLQRRFAGVRGAHTAISEEPEQLKGRARRLRVGTAHGAEPEALAILAFGDLSRATSRSSAFSRYGAMWKGRSN